MFFQFLSLYLHNEFNDLTNNIMKKIVIVGATSGIGRNLAELYADTDAKIAIVGRREEKLKEIVAKDKEKFIYRVCDVTQTEMLTKTLDDILQAFGVIDLMIISAGTGELNPDLDYKIEEPTLRTNILGWTYIVDWSMKQFEKQGFGHLTSISSVGGLRGNGVAPAYNASKSFQINYLEGMRQKANKLNKRIFVTDIRPGFVDTAMAKGEGLFWVATIEKAGKQIFAAIQRKKKVAYITKRWHLVALILKLLPSSVYCKIG